MPLLCRKVENVRPIQADPARDRETMRQMPADGIEKGRLSDARWSHEGRDRSGLDAQRQSREKRRRLTEPDRQMIHDKAHDRAAPRRSRRFR